MSERCHEVWSLRLTAGAVGGNVSGQVGGVTEKAVELTLGRSLAYASAHDETPSRMRSENTGGACRLGVDRECGGPLGRAAQAPGEGDENGDNAR